MSIFDLFKPRWKRSSRKVRRDAVVNLDNTMILGQVALQEVDYEIRRLALDAIHNEDVKVEVALKDQDSRIRKLAVAKITSQFSLFKVICESTDLAVRCAAVDCLTDPTLLGKVIANDKYQFSLRLDAVERLNNRHEVLQLLQQKMDGKVRKALQAKFKKLDVK
jgi:hypothetical protein